MERQPTLRFLPTQAVAADTLLIRQLADTGDRSAFVPLNSLVIRGAEPVIVDTGGRPTSAQWLEHVFGLVDPEDVCWVVVTHEDPDHSGGLASLVEHCPQAVIVASAFGHERLAPIAPIAPNRVRVVEPGGALALRDRMLSFSRPPIFDSPTTVAVFDHRTGVYWGADAFAAVLPDAVDDAADLDADVFVDNFLYAQRLLSPWHQWLDSDRYGAHLDGLRALSPHVAVGAHGVALHDDQVDGAFDLFSLLASEPGFQEAP